MNEVAAVFPTATPLRKSSYPATPALSEEALQLSPIAVLEVDRTRRLAGGVGGTRSGAGSGAAVAHEVVVASASVGLDFLPERSFELTEIR